MTAKPSVPLNIDKVAEVVENSNAKKSPGRRLIWQLALSITLFIFVVELVVLAFSHVSKRQELFELRDALERDVMSTTGQHFHDLHPGILDEEDIAERLTQFTINYSLITLLISLLVAFGTLVVFHRIAGRYLLRVIDSNTRYNHRKVDAGSLCPEDELPANELADLIVTRNRMIESIMRYEACMEQELEQTRQQLVHTARLSLIAELTSTTVHDIKNPLAVIMGRAALLKNKSHDRKMLEGLDSIENAAGKILSLSERMGAFSRLSDHHLSQVDLSQVIKNSLEMTRTKLQQIRVQVGLDISGIPNLIADQLGLEQLFANLFSNAADAMVDSPKRLLTVSWEWIEDDILITVEDTGIGVPKERIQSIFLPFFTTKDPGKGTGLGLSSCKRVVERHHGSIGIQSTVNEGSRFLI